jgi:hypothetical protein
MVNERPRDVHFREIPSSAKICTHRELLTSYLLGDGDRVSLHLYHGVALRLLLLNLVLVGQLAPLFLFFPQHEGRQRACILLLHRENVRTGASCTEISLLCSAKDTGYRKPLLKNLSLKTQSRRRRRARIIFFLTARTYKLGHPAGNSLKLWSRMIKVRANLSSLPEHEGRRRACVLLLKRETTAGGIR